MINSHSFYNNYTRLADLYKVSTSTFIKLISPIGFQIKVGEERIILYPREIKRIIDYLGEPGLINGYDYFKIRTIASLAKEYKVSRQTMSKWVSQAPVKYDNRYRKILTPHEVELIMYSLGLP